MKTLFPGYYKPSEQEFERMWQEGIFAFDANMLLNIYRYTPETQKSFFDVLEKLAARIWIPFQVAHEFQINRLNVISAQEKAYTEIENLFDQILKKLEGGLNSYRKHTFVDVKRLLKSIEKEFNRAKSGIQKVKAEHPNYFDADPLRDKITDLFEGKVGNEYNEKELEDLYKKAEKRFTSSPPIPPGYKDAKTKDAPQKYGDTIVWFQLMDYAKQNKKPMFLITDERKEDWWFIHDGRTIGPRPELIQEMMSVAGIPFYMYQSDKFLAYAQDFLGIKDQGTAIEEAKAIREQDEEQQRVNTDSFVWGEGAWGEGTFASPTTKRIRELESTLKSHQALDQFRDLASTPIHDAAMRIARDLESTPAQQAALRQMRELESNPAYQAAERHMKEVESTPTYRAMIRERERLESNPSYQAAMRHMRELESNPNYRIIRDLLRRGF